MCHACHIAGSDITWLPQLKEEQAQEEMVSAQLQPFTTLLINTPRNRLLSETSDHLLCKIGSEIPHSGLFDWHWGNKKGIGKIHHKKLTPDQLSRYQLLGPSPVFYILITLTVFCNIQKWKANTWNITVICRRDKLSVTSFWNLAAILRVAAENWSLSPFTQGCFGKCCLIFQGYNFFEQYMHLSDLLLPSVQCESQVLNYIPKMTEVTKFHENNHYNFWKKHSVNKKQVIHLLLYYFCQFKITMHGVKNSKYMLANSL